MRGLQATSIENESSATEIEEQEQSNTASYQVKLHLHQGRFISKNLILCSLNGAT